jgi:hypothetical protein
MYYNVSTATRHWALHECINWDADLREQMVHDVGANVVVDLVEDAVVTVQGGEASTQVGPLLTTVPGQLLAGVVGPVVVQVGHHVKPDLKNQGRGCVV